MDSFHCRRRGRPVGGSFSEKQDDTERRRRAKEHFFARCQMKKAVMYGAGNIGRGFIGERFSLSGYETAFIDINMTVIDRLNNDHEYPLYITKGAEYQQTAVKNVRGVNGKDVAAVAAEIAACDIMATAVGVNVLPFITEPVAAGIKARFEAGARPLNIIICENKLGADAYLRELIGQKLEGDVLAYFNESVGLVEASIGRMVPATPKEISEKNPLAVCVEEYCTLPVDKDAFKGEIPEIKGMVPFAPFEFYIQRKLFMHNMSHALTAYLGNLKGYTHIWQAATDAQIQIIALRALMESSQALSQIHNVPLPELIDHSEDLLYRFENKLLGDPVSRVGNDTIRKLSPSDRLVGAYNAAVKCGIHPVYIELGIAAALHFAPAGDERSAEVAACAANEGVAVALGKYSNITCKKAVEEITALYDLLSSFDGDTLFLKLQELKHNN